MENQDIKSNLLEPPLTVENSEPQITPDSYDFVEDQNKLIREIAQVVKNNGDILNANAARMESITASLARLAEVTERLLNRVMELDAKIK